VNKLSVLIAVKPVSLSRVIEHLLRQVHGIEVLGRVEDAKLLPELAGRLAPDIVVANFSLLGREPGELVAGVKSSSPFTRLILISRVEGLASSARRSGADAHLPEEALVKRLLPVLERLGRRFETVRSGAPRPAARA
jgi:DNA-binding NarL/FixJ family response regulator